MSANREGQPVPEVTFHTRQGAEWVDRTSKEIFANRTVIVFSLPGAFTPTCSSTHVPRYNQFAPAFHKAGVDEIICMSVNDAFVMNEWQEDQHAGDITFIPDGNGEFTEKMGLLVNKDAIGFGRRSWRYSMLVRNGIIEKMFVEPQEPGDPFKVSDADTMLAYLAPNARKTARCHAVYPQELPALCAGQGRPDGCRYPLRGTGAEQGLHGYHAACSGRFNLRAAGLHQRQAYRRCRCDRGLAQEPQGG